MKTELKSEMGTDIEVTGSGSGKMAAFDGMTIMKSEVETDAEVAVDAMQKEKTTVKSEVDIDTGVAENRPMVGSEYYGADKPSMNLMKTEVKIEIDVAEDSSVYLGMTAEQHTHESDDAEDLPVRFGERGHGNEAAGSGRGVKMDVAKDPSLTWSQATRRGQGSGRTGHPSKTKKHTAVDCSTSSAAVKKPKKTYVCQQCGAVFQQSSHLKDHNRIHTGEKPHVCQQCGKAFSQSSHLKEHNLIHTGEKPHVCQQCGKAFTQAGDLKKHNTIHTGEKPHICQQCGAAFTQSINLKTHMLIHTGEKPHVCQQCGAAFRKSSHLKKHSLIHTGDHPHKCLHCNASFRQSRDLNKHTHLHTG